MLEYTCAAGAGCCHRTYRVCSEPRCKREEAVLCDGENCDVPLCKEHAARIRDNFDLCGRCLLREVHGVPDS